MRSFAGGTRWSFRSREGAVALGQRTRARPQPRGVWHLVQQLPPPGDTSGEDRLPEAPRDPRALTRRGRIFPRPGEALLLLLGVAVSLLIAEGAVRLARAGDPRATGYAPVNTRRPENGWTNSLGYRDNEHRPAKPPGVRRVVVLGDSFTWGAKVEFDDAYPRRLERGLARHRGEAWEVISLARSGMNTVEEAEQLGTEGLAYDPDVVVLGYCLNDSEDDNAAEARRARDWTEMKKERRSPSDGLERSALYRLIRRRIWATVENRRRIAAYRSMYAPEYPGWIAGQRALKSMAEWCRERKVPFLVMIFPLFGNPLDRDYPFPEIHAAVSRAAAEAGARVVDLLPAYRGLNWELLVVDGPNDEHPNEIAHRIAADVLLSALDDVLPPPARRASLPPPGGASKPPSRADLP